MTSRIKPKSLEKPAVTADDTEVHNGKVVDARSNFALLEVTPWLIASLAGLAIRRPTAIQKACIPEILKGRDVIGGSRTGSGKTVAFAVPILQRLFEDPMGIYAVVLTPTRELALQIYEQFKAISALHSLDAVLITGGTEHRPQALDLGRRPHIVIATPGRLADHIMYSGADTIAGLRKVKCLVLDEADRLLAEGEGSMLPDVVTCLDAMPPATQRQTCLFTATMTDNVMKLRDRPRPEGKPPVAVCEIDREADLAIPSTLLQSFVELNDIHRDKYLHVLLQTPRSMAQKSIIVFCNRKKTADILERLLRGLDHSVTSIHSDLSQSERNSNLSRFRANASRILVATDVVSRGLDIPEVRLVINYDLPRNPDDYIHRVGRTARAGRKGEAISFVGQRDINLVHAIEERSGAKMTEYAEEGVNLTTRLARDAFKDVGIKKREVLIAIDEGRDVKGNRKRGKISRLQ